MRERTNALSLVRVSTDEQALEGVSLAAQRDSIRAEVERRSLNLIDTVAEDVSAKTIDARHRPKLAHLRARLDDGEADCLIVQRLDRLSRKMSDVMRILDGADQHGWALIVVSPSLDSAKPTDRVFFHLLALIAEQERSLIRARTSEGMRRARTDGAVLGRQRMPRETAALILALRNEGLSDTEVARELDRQHVPTPQGGQRWYASTVARAFSQMSGHDLTNVKWVGKHNESEHDARARLAAEQAKRQERANG